jgi:hypothetical protein
MHRTLGVIFMIVGVIGIVICVLLIPAVWVGRSVVNDSVAQVVAQVEAPLQEAHATSGEFRSRIGNIRDTLSPLSQQADTAAQRGAVETQLADRLLQAIDDTIGPQYVRLREAYVGIREKLTGVSRLFDTLRRFVPDLPMLPADELSNMDTSLQSLDSSLRQVRADLVSGSLPDNLPGVEAMRKVGDGIRSVDTRLGNLDTTAGNIEARIVQMQNQVIQAQTTVDHMLTTLAAVLSLVFIYLAGLHGALFAYGRTLRMRIEETPRPIISTLPPTQPEPVPAAQPTTLTT